MPPSPIPDGYHGQRYQKSLRGPGGTTGTHSSCPVPAAVHPASQLKLSMAGPKVGLKWIEIILLFQEPPELRNHKYSNTRLK